MEQIIMVRDHAMMGQNSESRIELLNSHLFTELQSEVFSLLRTPLQSGHGIALTKSLTLTRTRHGTKLQAGAKAEERVAVAARARWGLQLQTHKNLRQRPSRLFCCPTWSEQATKWEMLVLGALCLEVWKVLFRASSNYNRCQKQLKSHNLICATTHVCCTCWESSGALTSRAASSHPKHWSTQQKSCFRFWVVKPKVTAVLRLPLSSNKNTMGCSIAVC